MKYLFSVLALLALVNVAHAQTVDANVKLVVTLPAKNVDGSNIPATGVGSISKMRIYLTRTATCPTTHAAEITAPFPSPVETTFTGATVGETLRACVSVGNTLNQFSALTNPVPAVVAAPIPGQAVIVEFKISINTGP